MLHVVLSHSHFRGQLQWGSSCAACILLWDIPKGDLGWQAYSWSTPPHGAAPSSTDGGPHSGSLVDRLEVPI